MIIKFILKRIVAPIVIVSAIVVSAVLGFTGVFTQRYNDNKYAKWMAGLDDNTSLREVNMPGSHDTMALYSIGNLAGQCQSLSLLDQLNLGVRFLDIRLKQDGDELKAVHGFIDQKSNFEKINETVTKFLQDNPGEFIIMSVKEEADASKPIGSFEDCLKKQINNKYLLDTSLPSKVGEVRGKVVLLSRYNNPTIGINAYNGWLDSTSFTLPNNDIYIQDEYKITSPEQKVDAIKKCFNESGHALKINFLSAYRTNYIPPSYAPSAALDINVWINKYIGDYADRNIVLYDFVTEANMNEFFKGVL